ncbi:formimidoylglutamate deiminase [Roseovarius spongiae]|uniref:Formimidoylglutamate deiminase n=1 Tax=Roseovarius spongiae TaxID=2320272 RepID=A0A3A8AV99_9RHOB|nr:formimidoylglutamate deiminase [Roseovarius spongiae]RKF16178.1 formimidoylglutamate deiminase [Roseovarius spongiae]
MIHARQALLGDGWAKDVRVDLADGRIAGIATGARARDGDVSVDTLLPALSNLHSHAFQRAMAGMTEQRRAGRDNFWTWREVMYQFMDQLTPEQIEAIAALVYVEMQEAGYAAVGEFHYVHHRAGGGHYDDIAELSQRIFAAAAQTGIGLTHLPVLYTYGGAGKAALAEGQRRFGNDVGTYHKLVEAARKGAAGLPGDTVIGIAPHSLRATAPDELREALAAREGGPVHIHAAEQVREVEDVQGWLGARPVEWLLENVGITPDWCLIHCTHMTDAEARGLARSRAVAGLCPITEANLGDGVFNGEVFLGAGGVFGVGSDSNVNISLTEELRTLEYAQRLHRRERNVMVRDEGSVGRALYTGAARGGAQALGRDAGEIAEGLWADLVAVDSSAPALCALTTEQLLDGLAFAAKDAVVTDLWSAGRHQVREGRHVAREAVLRDYRAAVADLLASV